MKPRNSTVRDGMEAGMKWDDVVGFHSTFSRQFVPAAVTLASHFTPFVPRSKPSRAAVIPASNTSFAFIPPTVGMVK